MDIKWSYYLISILYGVIFLLKFLNSEQHKSFKERYTETLSYNIHKKDFFYTIALISTVITMLINGTALLAGKSMVIETFIITLLIIGMAYLTGRIEMLTTREGVLLIDGTLVENKNIKEVVIKDKKQKTHYQILFEEPINGYEGIEFDLKADKQKTFNDYIKKI